MLSLDIGATGMLAQQLHVNVISNNIANMTTAGYKRQRPEFQDLIYQNKQRPGATSSDVGTLVPSGIQIGLGVKPGSVYRIMEQGSFEVTTNELDLAIAGKGFFQVQLPSGDTAYSRAGNFGINNNGDMVTSQGYLLEPNINIPEDAQDTIINNSGEVLVKLPGQTAYANQGQIQLAIFANEGGLEAIGDNLFLETESSSTPTTGNPNEESFGKLEQGILENSNVDVVEEITRLITAQRAYEMNSKVIQASDEMMGTVSNMR
jgi:flagellar basal-body rod protein FlgG